MKDKGTAVILIDVENQADLSIQALRKKLVQRFCVVEQLAFADYSRPSLRSMVRGLISSGVTPVHVDTFDGIGYIPNGVDRVMARTLGQVARRGHVDTIVVVSGDCYFVQPVKRARRLGKQVIVAANPDRAGWRLRNTASEFISLH
jgi:uncharacterized LabA/DUF88 family protein